MTDNDIIKALDCCTGLGCDKCKFNDGEQNTCSCEWELKNAAMEVLKRQQAEIERLKAENAELEAEVDKQYEQARADILGNMADGGASCHWCIDEHKKNAINTFAERLMEKAKSAIVFEKGIRKNIMWVSAMDIYELVEEMEGKNGRT